MRISQLAERCGVPVTTLRYYGSAGLLPADRTPAGYRVYGEEAVRRLAFIGAAKQLGLPLDEIRELLAVWEGGACREVKADLRPRVAARLDDATRRLAELTAFTATLHGALEQLDALPDRAGRCGPECGFRAAPDEPTSGPVHLPTAARGTAAEQAETDEQGETDGRVDTDRQEETAAGEADRERWRSAPVACSLTGEGVAERTAQWHRLLAGAERTSLPDGLRLTLPADRSGAVAGLAAAEQRCCPFLDFRLHLDGPHLHIEVRAPAEGIGLLTDLFGRAA